MDRNLRLTGPTPLPPAVLQALGRQMVSHRSGEFRACLRRVVEGLRPLLGTTAAILPFTASGTGGLEAALVNTISPGDRVLAVQNGYFGERFAEIAHSFGATVIPWSISFGQAADPVELSERVSAALPLTAVLLTHNETSTGVLNPLPELAAAIRAKSDALILVDGVSSVGAVEIEMDKWELDVVITASQKALMAPPGLTIIAASRRALAIAKNNSQQRHYFDFTRMATAVAEGTTTYTPAISCIYALDAALELIAAEGLPTVFARHQQLAAACREGMAALGFKGFADPVHASPTVTSVLVPAGRSASAIRHRLEQECGVIVSQGRGVWKDRMLRFGHMGYVESQHIVHLLQAMGKVIQV